MPTEIVICGGGIIGLFTAYHVLESPDLPSDARVTILESTAIGYGASSRAAGFIASNTSWHRPANYELCRLSEIEFKKIVDKFDGKASFGWRDCQAAGLLVGTDSGETLDDVYGENYAALESEGRQGTPPLWHSGEVVDMGVAGGGSGCSILLPRLLCSRIYQHCAQSGLRTIIATPTGRTGKTIHTSTGEDIRYDSLAIAAGPWCNDVCKALDLPPVAVIGGPGHCLHINPGYLPGGLHEVSSRVFFTGIANTIEGAGENLAALDTVHWFTKLSDEERRTGLATTLEIFPRADGKIFIAGENHIPAGTDRFPSRVHGLPPNPRDVASMLDLQLINRITRTAKCISPALDVENGARITHVDIAYRPVTIDKLPVIGKIYDSVFVCSGHGPYGLTLAPGSGLVMSDMLISAVLGRDLKLSADISGLNPHRFSQKEISEYTLFDHRPSSANL